MSPIAFENLEPRNYLFAGELDANFGLNGIASAQMPPSAAITGAVVQADGKIVVATSAELLRFNPNGSPDTSFGSAGVVNPPTVHTNFSTIALQRDGKLIVEEDTFLPGQFSVDLARYDLNRNGAPDTSFNASALAGKLFANYGLAVQRDGKLLVSGILSSNNTAAVIRLRADGSIDTRFGNQGIALGPQGAKIGQTLVEGVAVQSNGTIALIGETSDIFNSNTAFTQYFNSRGHITTVKSPRPLRSAFQPPTTNTVSFNVVTRTDGMFVIGGESGGSPFNAAQFIPAVPYLSFQGEATPSQVRILALAANRRNQVIAGQTDANGWTLERFAANQQPDSSFGPTGGGTAFIPLDSSGGQPVLHFIVPTADGHILAIGNNVIGNITLARVLGSPAPDTIPPTATLISADPLTAAAGFEYITLEYDDNFALKDSSVRSSNILIKGRGGLGTRKAVLAATSTGTPNSSVKIATYIVAGTHHRLWTSADNGTYSILLQPRQISDTSGNTAPSAAVGSFTVNIPQ
jgi:uncharacterized delta-60 repeat protein